MSKILAIPLSKKSTKPIFTTMASSGKQIHCLLDTGADMPVWCGSKDLLQLVFPTAELVNKKFLLGGFGKTPELVNIYKIPEFFLGGGDAVLTFRNLYIASSFGRNFGCDLILSATMFKHMDYIILNRKTDTPVLKIIYDKDIYYTQIVLYQKQSGLVEKIVSFANET